MKNSETKLKELKEKLELESMSSEEFLQFVYDCIMSMPDGWKDAMTRAYLKNEGQQFDQTTGKALTADSRYHIFNEHGRRALVTLVTLARKYPNTLYHLLKVVGNGE
jgi:hypothetical protein